MSVRIDEGWNAAGMQPYHPPSGRNGCGSHSSCSCEAAYLLYFSRSCCVVIVIVGRAKIISIMSCLDDFIFVFILHDIVYTV